MNALKLNSLAWNYVKALPYLFLLLGTVPAFAEGSRVVATGGGTTIEGSAGGGIVPWAVINGYGSSDEWSATAMATGVYVDDFSLKVIGASLSFDNRFELSVARQTFDLDTMGGELGQDIFGVKYKLAGELLYTAMPQITLGAQYKRVDDFAIPQAVGARDDWGVDVYIAASKVFFDAVAGRNLLLNGTVRATKANQTGLLGFGTQASNDYQFVLEASAAVLLTDNVALGIEYRQKPNELAFAREDDWQDVFLAWFINKHLSVVTAYANLGSIAGFADQQGWYVSVEGTL
ncbi:DUF3034 family protein [Shewanella baltica]|uniref:DUF3034 domain-containing protein n=1 Tax=Shewanella baltica (strain OS155 / ATCC BAA-1091) TaxID=325240 RepID=A3D7E6_SHEB5|nr:DUF3034 family protein [Shewanella baltica]ABN62659.1 conserved hypothetical protein [Shewanella baltica OS155]MCS6207919.1 DUF3034 family protein [Shewanella baltica]